jgi:hypothetical protein
VPLSGRCLAIAHEARALNPESELLFPGPRTGEQLSDMTLTKVLRDIGLADRAKKFNRIPSQYAAQSYDAALLLDSAIGKVKGNVADKKAFGAALQAADFKSVRGNFKFGANHFPVQDMYVFEVAKDAKGRVNLKTIGTPLKNHTDAYASQCKM